MGGQITKNYPENIDGVKEDEYIKENRYFIHRAIQCTWWVWEEGYRYLFWRWPRDFRYAIRDGQNHWEWRGTWNVRGNELSLGAIKDFHREYKREWEGLRPPLMVRKLQKVSE